jgi:hypothetical protein
LEDQSSKVGKGRRAMKRVRERSDLERRRERISRMEQNAGRIK